MFITFEGIEGCGKSTQVARLATRLKQYGIPITTTFEPGGTRIGEDIRKILLDARNQELSPLTELALYTADRAQHVQEVIKPALERGEWVLCDRFADATLVYQGIARGLNRKLIELLNGEATQGIGPNVTFLLDCPAETGLKRALERNRAVPQEGQDRFEREALDFHRSVRQGYLGLAREHPGRFVIIDATLAEDEVEEEIFRHIRPYLEGDRIP